MITAKNLRLINLYVLLMGLTSASLFNACRQPGNASAKKTDTVAAAKTTAPAAAAVPDTNSADTTADDECPKAAAVPAIKKEVFPDTKFVLEPDHRTGIETVSFSNGDKLILKQSGCEYYTLSFRFETSRFAADTSDIGYWSNAALLLLRQTAKGLDVPLEVSEALNKLSARIEKDKSGSGTRLTLNEEIDFGGPDPREYLTIEQVSKLTNERYAIVVSLNYGPL